MQVQCKTTKHTMCMHNHQELFQLIPFPHWQVDSCSSDQERWSSSELMSRNGMHSILQHYYLHANPSEIADCFSLLCLTIHLFLVF